MRILYFDCFSGISGDMVVGALLDMGLSLNYLKTELRKLGLGNFPIKRKKVKRGDVVCTRFYVDVENSTRLNKMNFRDKKSIFMLLEKSKLATPAKNLAKEIFLNLFKAESKVHNEHIDSIMLSELADIDSIADIVSAAILITALRVDKVYASRVVLGRGFVDTKDGVLPVPAPAALELLQGIPISLLDINHELVTPTGASILKTLVHSFKEPQFEIEKVGYGAGSTVRKDDVPNTLRIMLGAEKSEGLFSDDVFMIEANIDDTPPLHFEYVIDKLLAQGALDVSIAPIVMKKSRPAHLFTALTEEKSLDKIIATIFHETTTFGVRYFKVKRKKLQKEIKKVKTPYGSVRVKIGSIAGSSITISPEYEDCKKIALRRHLPLKKVYETATHCYKNG
ncbi:MAG: nickel pincer cofactor biosynthesis protein LarC [Candidatus Omnitrophota bacterium]